MIDNIKVKENVAKMMLDGWCADCDQDVNICFSKGPKCMEVQKDKEEDDDEKSV